MNALDLWLLKQKLLVAKGNKFLSNKKTQLLRELEKKVVASGKKTGSQQP